MQLITQRLTIRLPEPGEGWKFAKYYRDNREFLQPYYPKFTAEDFDDRTWESLIPLVRAEYQSRRALRLALYLDSEVQGVVNITNVSRSPRYAATLGYSLSQSAQGKGLMSEALELIVPEAMNRLSLHRLEAGYMPRNERSARVLEKLGFEKEGLAREYIQINGVWEDHILTARIHPSWRAQSSD